MSNVQINFINSKGKSITVEEDVTFLIGYDHLPYAVFPTNTYSYEYAEMLSIENSTISHFGNYENAVLIQQTIGL